MELWKDIEGYEGLYLISNFGRVKSLERSWVTASKWLKTKPECILKMNYSKKNGYLVVSLYKNGRGLTQRVNRLVATAFISNPENKPYVNHKNCIKEDNRVENLEWCTNDENMAHAKINKRFKGAIGESNHGTNLKNEDVVEIRQKYKSGNYTYRELASVYDINISTCHSLVNNKTWKHIN